MDNSTGPLNNPPGNNPQGPGGNIPLPPVSRPSPYAGAPPQPRRKGGWRTIMIVVLGLLLVGSVLGNFLLAIGIAALASNNNGTHANIASVTERDGDSGKVAILPIEGTIDGGTEELVRQYCAAVRDDASIKAIVLELNTPGGEVTSADEIYHMLKQLASERQLHVVVAMRALAASGGYYIAMAGEEIYAEPTTITGSIGVIMPTFEIKDLLDKIGVTPEVITSDQAVFKDAGAPWKHFTPEDRAYLKSLVNDDHEKFSKIVADGRSGKLTKPMSEIAVGKVWPSDVALTLGLIDKIGYPDDACAAAGRLAGLGNPTIIRLKQRMGFLSALGAGSAVGSPSAGPLKLQIDPKAIDDALRTPKLEYRWVP